MNKYGDKAIEILNELHTECLEYHSEYLPLIKCANRCAEYEGTGLTPNQLTKAAALYKAQEEGRLVELPSKEIKESVQIPVGAPTDIARPSRDFSVKPCPFCGGDNIFYWQFKHGPGLRWRIVCHDCIAMIDPGWTQERGELAYRWNKRANEPITGRVTK